LFAGIALRPTQTG